MQARPILMSAPMVKALLAGTKTQTRRVVKPQPECGFIVGGPGSPTCPSGAPGDLLYVKEAWRTARSLDDLDAGEIAAKCLDAGYKSPWTPTKFESDGYMCSTWNGFGNAHERAQPGRYRHARFMPRWASRITLRITDVRVQRLQGISEADAIAEGLPAGDRWTTDASRDLVHPHFSISCYSQLWEDINGEGSWAANPWVWAITFETIQRNVERILREAA